ncbi:glycosyltransferase [Cytophagaceae bacterium YF14B1]|uniref:Glycosyltransferase n=1 Tax=Xanthocytophaga flava TaxID=3048013 RepID=A0AAE3QN84_9BACT|nr:glycosyltransferase [Xanthocytophaga flavus]MDJ1482160.1 glycosyltransferase [Xanthocytophaga flavus]
MNLQADKNYRTIIPPLLTDSERPLWSVMIPTYNCADYLRETLQAVLSQDPGPHKMQIEVVDDCSTKDDPEKVVNELGKGRVSFFRQPQNVGHTKNFDTCLSRSRGQLVHLLHGDDRVRNGFYEKIGKLFLDYEEIGAAFCRHIFMDENSHWQLLSPLESPKPGILDGWFEKIAIKQRILTPSIVVKREVYEQLGSFDHRLSWAEDWEMWARIAAYYPIAYEPEPLAEYRSHSTSNTGRYIRTAENLRDLKRASYIINSYVKDSHKKDLLQRSFQKHTDYGIQTLKQFYLSGDKEGAMAQWKEVWQLSKSPYILWLGLIYWLKFLKRGK